jgi:hypothetical protein
LAAQALGQYNKGGELTAFFVARSQANPASSSTTHRYWPEKKRK